jgi:phosphohistidine phosphatase SixA
MKTFKALVKAQVKDNVRNLAVEIRANSSAEAKWLLQAIYGFHAVLSSPVEVQESFANEGIMTQPPSPEQQQIARLKAAKERASTALKNERDRQKRSKAMKSLRSLTIRTV